MSPNRIRHYGFCSCSAFVRIRSDKTWAKHRAKKTWTNGAPAPICKHSLKPVPPEQAP